MPSVRTNISDNLLSLLSSIQTSNGYKTDIGDIHYEVTAIDTFKNFPAINVEWGIEKYLNADDPILNQDRKLHKELAVYLDIFIEANTDPYIVREMLVWDIKKMLMNNYDLNGSCHTALFVDVLDFGVESNSPYIGVSIELKIIYNTDILNPSLQA